MATERAVNGEIPVEALLAQLRRAAEQDGVEDVDAVVAEFATFVRAQAPRIAAQRAGRRNGLSFSGALLTAGALSVAAFGAIASGLVTNPLLPSTPSGGDASATADDRDSNEDTLVLAGPDGTDDGSDDGQGSSGAGAPGAAATDVLTDPAPATEFAETAPMAFTDPDALAVLAEQRSAGPTPPPSTTPVTPSTTAEATDGEATPDPADPTDPTSPTNPAPTDTTTTTLPAPVLDASPGPETLTSPIATIDPQTQQTQQQTQQHDASNDQGGAG